MAEEIEYEQFEQTEQPDVGGAVDLGRVSDIPMELSVEIGRTQMTVGETLTLRVGTVVTLDRFAGEPVELLANGTPIALGEVVVVDDKFGLRIKQIVDGEAHAHEPESGEGEPVSGEGELTSGAGEPASGDGELTSGAGEPASGEGDLAAPGAVAEIEPAQDAEQVDATPVLELDEQADGELAA
jgi:flagellar motor switch protein FliN/FliY